MGNTVFILGAGFSHAIYSGMPLVSQLSRRLARYELSHTDSAVNYLLEKNFEEALAYLVERKPWMGEIEHLQHQIILQKLTRNIGYAISKDQREALRQIRSATSHWAIDLVSWWHRNQATVLTLNYDVIVEALANRVLYESRGDSKGLLACARIYPRVLVPGGVRSGAVMLSDSSTAEKTFRLLKLHGSINWYYSGMHDSRGEVIYFTPPDSVPEDPGDPLPESVSDKVPFIVPPVPSKGSLVSHESVRAMWTSASQALQHADRLVIMGYSMPPNDHLISQLLRERFKPGAKVEIVDPNLSLLPRVKNLLGENVSQNSSGPQCVADFVSQLK